MLDKEQFGKIVRVIYGKGFGFIEGENSKTYFFHIHETRDFDRMVIGDRVVFFEQEHERGLRAVRVRSCNS